MPWHSIFLCLNSAIYTTQYFVFLFELNFSFVLPESKIDSNKCKIDPLLTKSLNGSPIHLFFLKDLFTWKAELQCGEVGSKFRVTSLESTPSPATFFLLATCDFHLSSEWGAPHWLYQSNHSCFVLPLCLLASPVPLRTWVGQWR